MKIKVVFLTVLMTLWAVGGFAAEFEPVMEPAELRTRLIAERDALGATQADERFDVIKDLTLQDALNATLPKRSPYQETLAILANISETEIALQRANKSSPLAAERTDQIRAEMLSKSLLDLLTRRSTLLTYFTVDTEADPVDPAEAMRSLYAKRLTQEEADNLCIYLFSRKTKGENLSDEIRMFVSGQNGAGGDIYNNLCFKVICAAHGLGYTDGLGNKERLSNTVMAIGDVFGGNRVDEIFNSLGHNDTWPIWRNEYGVKDGNRGEKAYQAARGSAVTSDNAFKREIKRIINKL